VRGQAPRPAAIEYFDSGALDLLRRRRRDTTAFAAIPEPPAGPHAAVYVEYHGDTEAGVEAAVGAAGAHLRAQGGDEDATWLAADAREIDRLKAFRHAVPEAVNLTVDERRRAEPGLTKLGTDLAVPDAALERVMAMYREGLARAGLEHVLFGHIGDNHLHVNILARNLDEYTRGKALYREWARAVLAMGGTVAAEHGIGKLKAELLREMVGEAGLAEMRAVKRAFDPDGRLNPGNLGL
jgi:D-lactate dehydrogenase (cytochrome)